MRITELKISNFRGIRASTLLLPQHGVLIGDNNVGKSTILEAIDLCLGPDRLSRQPPVDEHDFYLGQYLAPKVAEVAAVEAAEAVEAAPHVVEGADAPGQEPSENPVIQIDVTITDLSEEQQDHFGEQIEWWDSDTNVLFSGEAAELDQANATAAIRVTFRGYYYEDEDDFAGSTLFTRSIDEDEKPTLWQFIVQPNFDFAGLTD